MNKKFTKENHSITKIYVAEESVSEIDMDLYDKVLGKGWSDREDRFGEITLKDDKENGWQGASHPIEIDSLINTLEVLKAKGSNYVEVMYHGDHIGYYFYGLDIHRSTDKEITDEKKLIDKEQKKQKEAEIKLLEDKLAKLKKNG